MRFRVALSNSTRVSVLVNNFPFPLFFIFILFFLLLLLGRLAPRYLSYLIDSSGLELGKNKLWARDKGSKESEGEGWRAKGYSRIRCPFAALFIGVNVKRIVPSVATYV